MNNKTLKLIQLFETLVPKRSEDLLKKEYSDEILKEIKSREEQEEKRKELENAPKLAIEGSPEEGGNEPKKEGDENKDQSKEEKEIGKISPSKQMETEEEKEKTEEVAVTAPTDDAKKTAEGEVPKDGGNAATADPAASPAPDMQIVDLKEEKEKTEE